eukprot:2526188-Amphidinium_carterae.1
MMIKQFAHSAREDSSVLLQECCTNGITRGEPSWYISEFDSRFVVVHFMLLKGPEHYKLFLR